MLITNVRSITNTQTLMQVMMELTQRDSNNPGITWRLYQGYIYKHNEVHVLQSVHVQLQGLQSYYTVGSAKSLVDEH